MVPCGGVIMVTCVSVLGSTGSIGRQSLDIISRMPIRVAALTAGTSVDRMAEQCRQFLPELGQYLYVMVYCQIQVLLGFCLVKLRLLYHHINILTDSWSLGGNLLDNALKSLAHVPHALGMFPFPFNQCFGLKFCILISKDDESIIPCLTRLRF